MLACLPLGAQMGLINEKNRYRKSHDSAPLKAATAHCRALKKEYRHTTVLSTIYTAG